MKKIVQRRRCAFQPGIPRKRENRPEQRATSFGEGGISFTKRCEGGGLGGERPGLTGDDMLEISTNGK